MMGAQTEKLSAEMFDNEIVGFSIDSRNTGAGELFFALSQEDYARAGFNGTFVDAHRFIPQAFAKGAIAAVARADRQVRAVLARRDLPVGRKRLRIEPSRQ